MATLSQKELRKLAYINPRPGDSITNVIAAMLERSNTHNIRVTCVFNDAQFTVEPGMDAETAYALWHTEMERQGEQWSKSMKAEASRRKQRARADADAARGIEIRTMLQEESIQVPEDKLAEFNDVVKANSSDGYSMAAVNYAISWAVAMQRAMRDGKTLESVAEELSHYVDYEGITGFMYGWAVSFLASFWQFGEQLRRWHNINTQLGNEGEQANESGGVLNPALLVIDQK